jgi:hypothetical protein
VAIGRQQLSKSCGAPAPIRDSFGNNAAILQTICNSGNSSSQPSPEAQVIMGRGEILMKPILCGVALFCAVLGVRLRAPSPNGGDSFIRPMHTIKAHASTVPKDGDVNPNGAVWCPMARANCATITCW